MTAPASFRRRTGSVSHRQRVPPDRHAGGCRSALKIEYIFHGNGDAVQDTSSMSCNDFGISNLGLLQGEVKGLCDERIQVAMLRHSLDLMPGELEG